MSVRWFSKFKRHFDQNHIYNVIAVNIEIFPQKSIKKNHQQVTLHIALPWPSNIRYLLSWLFFCCSFGGQLFRPTSLHITYQ